MNKWMIVFENTASEDNVISVRAKLKELGLKSLKLGTAFSFTATEDQAKVIREMKGVQAVGKEAKTY